MNILILSSNIKSGLYQLSKLNEISNSYFVIICNPKNKRKFSFLFRQLFQSIFKLSINEKIELTRLFAKGIIKLSLSNIHSNNSIRWISRKNFDLGIHGINTIYKENLLLCFKIGILNAHLGILPQFRGKSVVSWSIFEGKPNGISTFLIDRGIDTGEKIILSKEIDISNSINSLEAKQYLSSQTVIIYKEAISILSNKDYTFIKNDISKGKRYYSMSDLFTTFVDGILNSKLM